ncbi:MAG: hypothetical protein WAN30_03970 [Acidimicrobiales bacterium]
MAEDVADHDGASDDGLDKSRRAFLKRMAVLAFAVPAISSFNLDGFGASTNRSVAPKLAYAYSPSPETFLEPNQWFFYANQLEEMGSFQTDTFAVSYSPYDLGTIAP